MKLHDIFREKNITTNNEIIIFSFAKKIYKFRVKIKY